MAVVTGWSASGKTTETQTVRRSTLSLPFDINDGGEGRGARQRQRLLWISVGQSGRFADGVAVVGPPKHALGHDRTVGGRRLQGDGTLGEPTKIAGEEGESVFQPEWSPDGTLYFVSDRTGWWNLYRWRDGHIEAIAPMQAEFGAPAWALGTRTYAFESADRIVCKYVENGFWKLATIDTRTTQFTPVESPYTEMSRGDIVAGSGQVALEAGSAALPDSLLSLKP